LQDEASSMVISILENAVAIQSLQEGQSSSTCSKCYADGNLMQWPELHHEGENNS
jgi:hypothetical protein